MLNIPQNLRAGEKMSWVILSPHDMVKFRPFLISALLLFLLLSLFLLLFVFVVIGLLCRKNLCGPYKLL